MTGRVNLNKVFWRDLQHQLTKVPCPLCSRLMRDDRRLKSHMKLHENTCKDCGKCFSSAPKLSEHKNRVHVPNVCNHCDKSYKSPQDLKRHIDTVHLKIKKYSCNLCDGKFSDPTPLRYHMLRHKEDPNIRTNCSKCEKRIKAVSKAQRVPSGNSSFGTSSITPLHS